MDIKIVLLVVVTGFTILFIRVAFSWIKSIRTDYPLKYMRLMGMYLRKIDLSQIITINNEIHSNELSITLIQAEIYFLSGGKLQYLLEVAKAAKFNNKNLDFDLMLEELQEKSI